MLSKRAQARLPDIIEDAARIAAFLDDMSVPDFIAQYEVPALSAAAELALES